MFGKSQQMQPRRDIAHERDRMQYDALALLLVWERLYIDLHDDPAFENVFDAIYDANQALTGEDDE